MERGCVPGVCGAGNPRGCAAATVWRMTQTRGRQSYEGSSTYGAVDRPHGRPGRARRGRGGDCLGRRRCAGGTGRHADPPCAPGTNVNIDSGPICGMTVNGTNEWFGIPYAAPPVGALRWQPPQPPAPWTTTLAGDAVRKRVHAVIRYHGAPSAARIACSSTCGGPTTARPGSRCCCISTEAGSYLEAATATTACCPRPVTRLWCLSTTGWASLASWRTRTSARTPATTVCRISRPRMRWVQHNIGQFGGDPSNVTIYGESAGGSSVCDEIASPTAKGLFERGISVSGEYNTLLGSPNSLQQQDCKSQIPTQAQSFAAGKNFAAAAGGGKGTSDVASCLRNLSATAAQSAAGGGVVGGFFPVGYQDGGQGTVGPTINGTTLTMTLRQALASGHVESRSGDRWYRQRREPRWHRDNGGPIPDPGPHPIWVVRLAGPGEVSAQPLR